MEYGQTGVNSDKAKYARCGSDGVVPLDGIGGTAILVSARRAGLDRGAARLPAFRVAQRLQLAHLGWYWMI